jgi:hypothetical protein
MRITDLSADLFEILGSSESEKVTGGDVTVTAPRPIINAVNTEGKQIPRLVSGTLSFNNSGSSVLTVKEILRS